MQSNNIGRMLKISGIGGFILNAIATLVLYIYIQMPIILQETETQLRSMGIPVQQVRPELSIIPTVTEVTMPITMLIVWLIQSAILYGLFWAFKIRPSFTNTWLVSGNYYYIATISTAITGLYLTTLIPHITSPYMPQLLIIDLAFLIIGSIFLAYLFSKVYNTPFIKTFIPTLISLTILFIISTLPSLHTLQY